jgi:hypothetical protein
MHRALALTLNIFITPLNTAFTPLGTMSHTNSPLNDEIGAAIGRAVCFSMLQGHDLRSLASMLGLGL